MWNVAASIFFGLKLAIAFLTYIQSIFLERIPVYSTTRPFAVHNYFYHFPPMKSRRFAMATPMKNLENPGYPQWSRLKIQRFAIQGGHSVSPVGATTTPLIGIKKLQWNPLIWGHLCGFQRTTPFINHRDGAHLVGSWSLELLRK